MKKLALWIMALILIFNISNACADRPFNLHTIRPMGMGNTFTAVADDYNAIYFNPASIAQIDRFDIDVPLKFMVTQDTINLVSKISEISDDLKSSESKNEITLGFKNALNQLLELTDDTLGGETDLSIGWVLPNVKLGGSYFGIGLGAYAQFGVKTYIQPVGLPIQEPFNLLNDELIIQAGLDGIISGSIAMMTPMKLIPGKSSIGLTLKALNRKYLNNKENPIILSSLLREDIDVEKHLDIDKAITRAGVGFDLGWMCEYNEKLRFGLMIKDISNSLDVDPNFRIGIALKPMKSFTLGKKLPPVDAIFAMDLDNLNNGDKNRNKKLVDKLHLGTELKIAPFKNRALVLSLRAGNNQGFLTLGTGLKLLWLLNMDYAYFGDHVADWHTLSLSMSI
ncbi:MAG: hypothetical protein QMD92_07150 [bacterium]|nr:hypothetical protein [bacterium]